MAIQLKQPIRQVVVVQQPSGYKIQVTQSAVKSMVVSIPGLQGPPGALSGLPAGGLAGQALVKASDAPGDLAWAIPSPIDGGTFN